MQMQAMQVDTSAIQVLISKMHVQMAKAEGNILGTVGLVIDK